MGKHRMTNAIARTVGLAVISIWPAERLTGPRDFGPDDNRNRRGI